MNTNTCVATSAVVLAVLVVWERALVSGEARERSERAPVQRLIDPARLEGRPIAAVTLALPGQPEVTYARSAGRWRCATAYGAPARADALAELVGGLQGARGIPRTEDAGAAATYGLGDTDRALVRLHGAGLVDDPDRDVIVELEIGHSLGARERGFARVAGTTRVLEIDRDPRRWIDWPDGRALPPMLDTRVVAGAWPDGVRGFERVFVDLADGGGVELRRADERWLVVDGGTTADALPYRAYGYLLCLARIEYTGLLHPRERESSGHDPPRARLTVFPDDGEPLELAIGRRTADGSVFVWNATSRVLAQITAAEADLLTPTTAMLTDTGIANPWESWLSR